MPKEGHISVSLKVYIWEQMDNYFRVHKADLRKKGIKSTSGLIAYCLEHFPFERLFEGRKV